MLNSTFFDFKYCFLCVQGFKSNLSFDTILFLGFYSWESVLGNKILCAVKGGRICQPHMCYFGIKIILNYRHLKNTRCGKGTLADRSLPESRS